MILAENVFNTIVDNKIIDKKCQAYLCGRRQNTTGLPGEGIYSAAPWSVFLFLYLFRPDFIDGRAGLCYCLLQSLQELTHRHWFYRISGHIVILFMY